MERLQLVQLFEVHTTLQLRVIPNAKETVLSLADDGLVLRVHAVPDKGKANKAIISFFKKQYKLRVEIVSGQKSRLKRIRMK